VARREVAGRRLGALEADVMELAWDKGDWIGVNELLAALDGQQRAYTTVMTIVTRLCDKGLLERRREGRGFVYRPALSKEQLAARSLRDVLAGADDPQAVLAHFVKDLEASPALLARLRRLADGSKAGADSKADRA
jgi:BlaI family transcriptional regulator, penicillinase repressor